MDAGSANDAVGQQPDQQPDGHVGGQPDGGPSEGGQGQEGGPIGSAPDSTCSSAGPTSTYSTIGGGTTGDPYVLCNAAQLVSLSATTSAWKFSYRLGADIDLSGTTLSPIGTSSNPFQPGPWTVQATPSPTSLKGQDYQGLFGAIAGPAAEIRHLTMTGANVAGSDHVGILAGSVDRARVIDCATDGTVSGHSGVGGILGTGDLAITLSSSRSSASVTGNDGVGGLAGQADEGAFVANSYATGAVSGNNTVGGLIGGTHASTIRTSYSTGSVTGTGSADRIGGFIGAACSLIQLSFSTGSVSATASTGNDVYKFIGFWWCGSGVEDFEDEASTCATASGACPSDTGAQLAAVAATALQDRTKLPLSAWDFQAMWSSQKGGFPTLAPTLWDATTWSGCGANGSHPHVAGGTGTAEQPYLICSAAQFAALGGDSPWWASSSGQRTAVVYLVQMADIDLTGISLSPIGTNVPFEGVYDGQGYRLSPFTITSSAEQVGLIGNAENAHIQRVAAVGGNVTAPKATSAALIVGGDFGTITRAHYDGHGDGGDEDVGVCQWGGHAQRRQLLFGGKGERDRRARRLGSTEPVWSGLQHFGLVRCLRHRRGEGRRLSGCFLEPEPGERLLLRRLEDLLRVRDEAGLGDFGRELSLQSHTNPPFTHWDFDNVWVPRANDYPNLR